MPKAVCGSILFLPKKYVTSAKKTLIMSYFPKIKKAILYKNIRRI